MKKNKLIGLFTPLLVGIVPLIGACTILLSSNQHKTYYIDNKYFSDFQTYSAYIKKTYGVTSTNITNDN